LDRRLQLWLDIILVLTQKEIKIRYKNSILGYLWSIAHPLAFAFVFFVAFKVVMRINIENYTLFLIAGLFPWQWFSNSINNSPLIFLTNSSLIKKLNFPRNIISFSLVLQDMIHFLLSIPVIIFFLFLYEKHPGWNWLFGIPSLLLVQLALTYGISVFIASVNLFFRDLERLTGIFMTFLFYFTPIIYPEQMIPENYRNFIIINPLSPLIISWRNLFLNGNIDNKLILISFIYAIIFLIIGHVVYKKLSWKFAEVI